MGNVQVMGVSASGGAAESVHVWILLARYPIEVGDEARAVMLRDEILDARRQPVASG